MKRVRVALLAIAALVVVSVMAPKSVHGQNISQGLQISPVTIDFTATKGQSYTFNVSILNVTTGDLVFTSAVNDFTAKDESGTPQFLLDSKLPSNVSITSWITPPASFMVKSKQTVTLPIKINVPVNAEPGGHYGILRFSGRAPDIDQTGVALKVSAGPLILIKVNGEISEKLRFSEFFTAQGSSHKGLFEKAPITVVERLTNDGNIHLKPKGDVIITNMFGSVVGTLKVNNKDGNVLPKSTRRFEQTFAKKNLFGKYTASAKLAYGTHGQVLSSNLTFWVIPYKLIAILLLILIVLIFILSRLIKSYNKRVVNKALSQNKHDNHPPHTR
jgi:hypothetical protein